MKTIEDLRKPKTIDDLRGKVYEAPTEWLRTKEVPEVLEEKRTQGIGLGPMWDEPGDTRTMRERLGYDDKAQELYDKIGVPEIFKGIREMIAPTTEYTKEESARQLKEIPEKILWTLKYVPTLGGRLGGKGFRKNLLEQAEEFAGFGPALGPAVGEGTVLALEWGLIYPTLFKAAGLGGEIVSEIPRVAKATAALKKAGGLEKIAEKFPRLYARAANVVKAMGKGTFVGGFMAGTETIGKEMKPGEILQHTGQRAALMAGVAGVFQAVSEVDTALYTRKLRNALIRASNSQFATKIREIDAMPISAVKSAAYKSLSSLKKAELQAIDKIVSATEANLLGLKKNKLYQLGQEVVERPDRAAERLMRYGLEKVGEVPRGVEKLTKGLGRTEPFIKMPLTRTAEVIESTKELGALLRKPSRIAEKILRTKLPVKPAKVTPPPLTPPAKDIQTWEDIKKEAEIAEMDRELAEITGQTPSTVGVPAPMEAVAVRPEVKTPVIPQEAGKAAPEGKLTAQQEGMKDEALRTAKKEGIEVTPEGNLILYHGTRSAKTIRESGNLPIGTYFAADKTIAKRFAEQAQQKGKAEVIKVEVPAHKIFTSGGEELYFSANEPITVTEAQPVAKAEPTKKTIEDLREAISDEELSRITKHERRRLIKENAVKIESSDIYQNEVAGLETSAREVGPGYYYINKGYRGEVEAIIGKRKGPGTKIQRMFTFNPNETRIVTLQSGDKAEVGPTPWERAVQEGLGRGKEGVEETWGEMDISEFVQRVVDSYRAQETIGGINRQALEKAEQSGHPDMQMLAEKHRMLAEGFSDQQINEMISEWASEWGLEIEDIESEFVNEYGTKLRQIKKMAEPDDALEQLAIEQIEAEDRQAAAETAREVLEANDIQAEVEQVKEIRPVDLLGRPVLEGGAAGKQRGLGELGLEFTKPEAKDPDQLEFGDTIPFERRGKPVGAAITQGQEQVILLAYGADSETGYHEGYHILRRRLTDKDTRVLDKYFKGDEEAEAIAFAEYVKTGKTQTFLRGIWQKLRNVLRKVKSGLQGRGFKTAEDIFVGIRSGEIKKTTAKGGVAYETRGEKARREVEKNSRIKARKARLASQAGIKKRRVRQAPRIRLKLHDHTPPLRADLAPLKPEAAEERPLKTKTLTKPVYTEKWFEENLKRERRSVLDKASSEARRAWMGLEKVFSSSSTRLNNIAPKLFRATRQYIYNVLTRSTAMTQEVSDFVKATRKMGKDDWRQLDLAFKNGIDWKIDQIVSKYNLTEQFQRARAVLDDIYDAAKEVGIDIDYRKNYWPRVLKDPEGFLMYFQGREDWSIIEEAIKRRAKQAGRKIEDLTVDEKAHVVNTLLRGYRTQALTLSRPGPAKERTVESIDKKLDTFYDDSRTALHKYIKLMNAKIAEREFFGRETKEIQNLRKTQSARLTRLLKLKRRVGLKYPSEPAYKEHISKTAQNWKEGQERLDRLKARPLSETIGGYVQRLKAAGEISPTQEKEIQNILTGIFDPQRMGSRMGVFATGVYIDTLNSPLQALTQLDEFAYSFYRSPLRSIPVAIRTAARKSKITPRDIGITSVGEEFQGPSMQRSLSLLLKSTGFEMIDRLNKENYINTVLSKYQAQAKRKNLKADFLNRMRKVFGDDYKGVLEDLRNNRISDNVKYLLFNEILDIQPIAITEMPEAYNKAGNMRILYSLKTFYMKRLDFIRNECFKDMKSSKTFAKGFGKLVWLAFSFALMGAGSDFLKDFIRGKPFELKDSIADNLLRMVFFSKYQAWRTREKGLGTALLEGWRPPTKAIDSLTRDIINEAQGKERGWELWRSVPIVGEEYYWWFGQGRRKTEGKKSPVD